MQRPRGQSCVATGQEFPHKRWLTVTLKGVILLSETKLGEETQL